VTCGRPLIFSKYSDKADRHDITEILLKVALNTITHYNYEKKVKTVMVNNSTNINKTKTTSQLNHRKHFPEPLNKLPIFVALKLLNL
jgi:hypothetical protein